MEKKSNYTTWDLYRYLREEYGDEEMTINRLKAIRRKIDENCRLQACEVWDLSLRSIVIYNGLILEVMGIKLGLGDIVTLTLRNEFGNVIDFTTTLQGKISVVVYDTSDPY